MYDHFETNSAVYFIFNGEHFKHLKEWDKSSALKYYKIRVSTHEYVKEYRKAMMQRQWNTTPE